MVDAAAVITDAGNANVLLLAVRFSPRPVSPLTFFKLAAVCVAGMSVKRHGELRISRLVVMSQYVGPTSSCIGPAAPLLVLIVLRPSECDIDN